MSAPRPPKPGSLVELLANYEPPPGEGEHYAESLAHIHDARASYAEAAQLLLADLREAGYEATDSMEDLRAEGAGSAPAVPILLTHLPRITYLPLARDVIATLAQPWAASAARAALPGLFASIAGPDDDFTHELRWSIGDTLEKIADESIADDLLGIATNRSYGADRGLVVLALGNLKKSRDRVVPVLMKLVDDSDVAVTAIEALGRLKVAQARPKIEPFLRDDDSWVRDKAKRALAKLPKD